MLRAGCFIAPLTFQMYWRSFHIGDPGGPYKAPYANIYRGMAILGTQVTAFPRSPVLAAHQGHSSLSCFGCPPKGVMPLHAKVQLCTCCTAMCSVI